MSPKTKDIILQALRDHPDRYLSGQDLADQLSISRQAVWKAIKDLRQMGHPIESLPKRGYRLDNQPLPLREDKIRQRLIPQIKDLPLWIYPSLDSTNRVLSDLDKERDLPSLSLVLAEEQTQGRGRMGKSFQSPAYTGIYLSFLLKKDQGFSLDLVTIKASLALCLAIEEETDKTPQIKWVNDLYLEGKKIAGILTEGKIEKQGLTQSIVGIGLNFATPREVFQEDLRDKATSLFAQGVCREEIIASCLNHFYDLEKTWTPEEIIQAYSQRNLVLGREVSFLLGDISYQGQAKKITPEGYLLVDVDGQEVCLNSGQVSLLGDWS
ncbi:MAG: biotin--[acetyl-CoA-carboxylase] ligase [Tissierellia bacterium]|nr:biotin--[acetyl-CoA-carboxylase] ligase [Tissierellia bacterium]